MQEQAIHLDLACCCQYIFVFFPPTTRNQGRSLDDKGQYYTVELRSTSRPQQHEQRRAISHHHGMIAEMRHSHSEQNGRRAIRSLITSANISPHPRSNYSTCQHDMCSYLSSNAAVNATRKQVSKTGDPTSYVPSGRPNVVSQGIVPEISRERFKYVCVLRAFQHAGESTATDIYIYLYIYIM